MKIPRHVSRDDFDAQIRHLENLGYHERRYALWHRNKPRLPHHIYKFRAFNAENSTSVERLRDILVQCRLRLASPEEFNDPFDMAIKIEIKGTKVQIRKRLDKVLKERGMKWADRSKEVARAMQNFDVENIALRAGALFRDTITRAGICSFGGDPRSILMWSHYADSHRGVCLQFEVARDLTTFAQALPVNYSEEYPVLNWVNETDRIIPVLLRKYMGWSYEKERRIIVREAARQFINFRPAAIAGVILGCSASDKSVEQLKEIMVERRSQGFPEPKIYRTFTNEGKFRLNIKLQS